MLFFYKLKCEDLPLKNQIKSKSHRSIDSSIVLFGGRRSEVIFLVFFGCIFGGRGGGGGGGEGRNFNYKKCSIYYNLSLHRKGIVVRVSASRESHRIASRRPI